MSSELKPLDEQQTVIEESHPRRNPYGNLIVIGTDARGEPRYMLGPHYPLFFTALIVCTALVTFAIYNYYSALSLFWKILIVLSGSSFLLSYLKVGFSKPGLAKPKPNPTPLDRQAFRFCHTCNVMKDRNTEHCGDCDVCIQGFDHHCPWVGKCIGKENLCAFYTFLICTFTNIIIIFVATATVNIARHKAKG